jgi:heme A synthase
MPGPTLMTLAVRRRRFARYAWGVLAFILLVVLWGAFVRASGSGAGCGAHWPTCNGTIIQRAPRFETIVELSHRLTSGLSLVLVLGLVVQAFRLYPKGSSIRQGATMSGIFLLLEAAIGAGLVLLRLVGTDDSVARAIFIAVHLVNTFLLTAALTYTAYFAATSREQRLPVRSATPGRRLAVLGAALVFLAASASGAIVALGDTLFKAASLAEGMAQDLSPTAHFLIRLRVLHPLLAVTAAFYLLSVTFVLRTRTLDRRLRLASFALSWAVALQLALGMANLMLLAPTAMQLAHLLAANAVWIALCLFSFEALSTKSLAFNAGAPAPSPRPRPATP